MRELALFAGAGGGILGSILLGHTTVCAVELDPYCRSVLLARQRDGVLPRFPIWDDVCTFDGRPWRGHVDVVSGGFPCQDISSAGKGAGLNGERSGLWREFARIIGEVRPRYAFIENSPYLRTRGLVTVLQDLAELGYDAEWCVLGASDVGAPHIRKRMWIAADANVSGQQDVSQYAEVAGASSNAGDDGNVTDAHGETVRPQQRWSRRTGRQGETEPRGTLWWSVDCVSGVDDGMAHRMDRVRATGNGQVPAVVRAVWSLAR